jgi:plastocyanin
MPSLLAARTLVLAVLAATALLGAACGGDGEDAATTPAQESPAQQDTAAETAPAAEGTLEVTADPGGALEFTESQLTAEAGTVEVSLVNRSTTPHNVVIEQDGREIGSTETISEDTATTSVDLEAGSYTFFCSVPGHREAGMEGTLTVR